MRSTFKYLFYINRNKVKKNGLCPIMGRITLDGEIVQFSTGLETNPDLWDAKAGRSMGRTAHEIGVNKELKYLSTSIEKHYAYIVEKDGYVTAERVKNAVMNIAQEPTTLLKELEEATEEIQKSIGINHTVATYRAYVNAHLNLSRFIRDKYGKSDMPFSSLEYSFIENYDMYLKIDHKMATGSVMQHIVFLKKLVKRAMNKGVILRNPFLGYVPDQPKTSRKWLSCEEIQKVMTTPIEHPSVAFVRDMFVFGCWTGLSYTDIKNLQDINIVTDSEGNQWIDIKRQKTGSRSLVPLLDIPKEIIKKYKGTGEKGKVFKMLCMNVVCQYTKRIGKLCGLDMKLTFHMSRHSFGTSICLTQGVPIETLSQMMGHRNIKTTQIYAEITGAKIEEDMQRLSQKIENKYQLVKS
ncbi:site-specific integrase [Bacteroides fragilis]|uniref:site-specific integrase n=1 Tax=Bacteroides fragilis TaxID=817 RepID=UPI001F46538B|nr:site-specific integrase [Bacteroides fragilis]MCE8616776.1 site-specific integrase [Bacteroides fragilis]MCZ2603427.1 site-specific integrase [Bacteroides fragilis]UHZ86321.1 site-specific integrase [Bacteroides fragilis]